MRRRHGGSAMAQTRAGSARVLNKQRNLLNCMRRKAERVVHEAERAVAEVASAVEVESVKLLRQSAQVELAWQRVRQHDLDQYDTALMDNGGRTA